MLFYFVNCLSTKKVERKLNHLKIVVQRIAEKLLQLPICVICIKNCVYFQQILDVGQISVKINWRRTHNGPNMLLHKYVITNHTLNINCIIIAYHFFYILPFSIKPTASFITGHQYLISVGYSMFLMKLALNIIG